MTLATSQPDTTYYVSHVDHTEEGMREFLFSLGCYPGERVTTISRLAGTVVVSVKNARYSLDDALAGAIGVSPQPVAAPVASAADRVG